MSEDLRELAFRLHVRGIASDQVAAALQREHGAAVSGAEVDAWIRERFAADPATDPQRARTVAVIAEANRELWKAAASPSIQPAQKARYLESVARNEERLIRIDGRCGARLRGARAGRFCTSFPLRGARRCKMHGGASTGPKGPQPARTHGAYEIVTSHCRTPKVRADAIAHMTEAERLRASELREFTDLQGNREVIIGLRIAYERIERWRREQEHPLAGVDALTKVATAIFAGYGTNARLRGDPFNIVSKVGPATPVASLTDAQLTAIAATALVLHAAGEPT